MAKEDTERKTEFCKIFKDDSACKPATDTSTVPPESYSSKTEYISNLSKIGLGLDLYLWVSSEQAKCKLENGVNVVGLDKCRVLLEKNTPCLKF